MASHFYYRHYLHQQILLLIGLLGFVIIFSSILILSIIHNQNSRAQTKMENGLAVREKIPLNSSKMVRNPNYSPSNGMLVSESGLKLIEKNRIKSIKELGEGAFGRVFLGTVEYFQTGEDEKLVAIKTLKDSSDFQIRQDFESEAEVLSSLSHPNIVQFFGISLDGDTLMMIIEYMKFGDLNNFLRNRNPKTELVKINDECGPENELLTVSCLLRIAAQIASGLEYLSLQHFVHRDLATRNCLVGDDLLVKIGDFGMSRDLYATDYYKIGHQAKLPIRWMSPESIMYRKFTVQSDIWSFGIVLWEIFTFGKQPFYELSNQEVIKEIVEGKVLEQPDLCPKSVYDLMLSCWNLNPLRRISASEIVQKLGDAEIEAEKDMKSISESTDIMR